MVDVNSARKYTVLMYLFLLAIRSLIDALNGGRCTSETSSTLPSSTPCKHQGAELTSTVNNSEKMGSVIK
jgi:hypothetical protein